MTKLYELSEMYRSILERIYDSAGEGGEISPADSVLLSAIDDEFQTKVESCCKVLRELQTSIDAVDSEQKRLASKSKALKTHEGWLKDYMKHCLESAGETKVVTPLFKVSIVQSPVSVEFTDTDLIPSGYYKMPVPEISKTAVKEALQQGIVVPGAQLSTGTHLRVS